MSRSSSDSDYERESSLTDLNALQANLSDETFAALMQFLPNRRFDQQHDNFADAFDENTSCVAYTVGDATVIIETLSRLQQKHGVTQCAQDIADSNRILRPLLPCLEMDQLRLLQLDGVIRLNCALDVNICDRLLVSINTQLAFEIGSSNVMIQDTGFGNVLCRDNRWDLYLRNEGICNEALLDLIGGGSHLQSGLKHELGGNQLSRLFHNLFQGHDADFHELSALICDPGAKSQPIHPDSVFTVEAPMYTVFVALQDITHDMGATIFLPRSNTAECHAMHKDPSRKNAYLASSEYRQCLMNRGDVAVMDSRTLHCGDANTDHRRVLLYFTMRNPHVFPHCMPPIPTGSMWAGTHLSLSDFMTA